MEQDNLAALVKLIMADKRIQDLIRNGAGGYGGADLSKDLTLIETRDTFENLPFDWRVNVYCQERPDGGDGFLSCDAASRGEWSKLRIYQPSLNFIAKLALGIADEPLLKIVQQKLAGGAGSIELLRLSNLSRVRPESYRKLFLDHLDRIRSYGVKVSDDGMQSAERDCPKSDKDFSTAVKAPVPCAEVANAVDWQYKALTERDLQDICKGSVVTIGRKCIVTSLATDMARRKSIRICREGEVK
ncbi:MAG TPA: hypothetical protein PKA19_02075 [Bacillota bacterium]|nr:hypothetical protein [Bacillota bacterium]